MAEFNPDKLKERLDQLNDENLATMEKLIAELLSKMENDAPVPQRAEPREPPSHAA